MVASASRIALAVALLTIVLPTAGAAQTPPCTSVTEEATVELQDVYLQTRDEDADAWRETNDLEDLQPRSCEQDGTVYEADQRLARGGLSSCDAVEDTLNDTPARKVTGKLPGSVCDAVRAWKAFVEEFIGDGPDLPGQPDIWKTCDEVVGKIPPGDIRCR